MKTDIEISNSANLKHIIDIAEKVGIYEETEPWGRYKAKVNYTHVDADRNGKLILVTAISPTPAGEGKTTTTIGLADALSQIGKRSVVCLREPALGPVFGRKGGATGGGYSQVAPMEDINLHFTGDFAAIASAHNLLSAMIDNHIYHGNELGIETVTWRRVIDMNDRALRDQFDIVVASEIMAILCLVDSVQDLTKRLSEIVVGQTSTGEFIRAKDLNAQGAMTALLKDAVKPNLVQTLEGTPALIHGGPFANIAHGCNSVIATRLGLKIADYVVTEAGFGSDLGAEKFVDIKCRKAGLTPDAAVVVATVRALKYHGNGELERGLCNLAKHVDNVKNHYGLPTVVAINKFTDDTEEELNALVEYCTNKLQVPAVICTHWADGGKGAVGLAKQVLTMLEQEENKFKFVYDDDDTLFDKIKKVAEKVYGAENLLAPLDIQIQLHKWQDLGYKHFPICIAKTPSSFSTDPTWRGAPHQHAMWVDDVELRAGAEFIVVKMGKILTLPGLPKTPCANNISLNDHGQVIGLS